MNKLILIVAAAASLAIAQTNANLGVDWRYGRPGVFVLTNANGVVENTLTSRTITVNGVVGSLGTNLVFDVEGGTGGGVEAAEAAAIATNAALWASSFSYSPTNPPPSQITNSGYVTATSTNGWTTLFLVTP